MNKKLNSTFFLNFSLRWALSFDFLISVKRSWAVERSSGEKMMESVKNPNQDKPIPPDSAEHSQINLNPHDQGTTTLIQKPGTLNKNYLKPRQSYLGILRIAIIVSRRVNDKRDFCLSKCGHLKWDWVFTSARSPVQYKFSFISLRCRSAVVGFQRLHSTTTFISADITMATTTGFDRLTCFFRSLASCFRSSYSCPICSMFSISINWKRYRFKKLWVYFSFAGYPANLLVHQVSKL